MSKSRHRAGALPAGENRARDEGGFALIVALLALVGLTAMASAGFVLAESENDVSRNLVATAYADQAANAGLYDYLGTHSMATDTAAYTYTDGSAVVFGEQLLDLGDGRVLYRITSTGTYSVGMGGAATRTVTTAAIFSGGTVTATSAFTSGGGFHKNGSAGKLSGINASDPDECPGGAAPDIAGLAVPEGGFEQSGGGAVETGKKAVEEVLDAETCDGCEGNPPLDESGTAEEQLEKTGVDWDAIVNADAVNADYTIPPDGWPDFDSLDDDVWPVIYVTDPSYTVNPSESGRGTLIVRGNLTMNGSFSWDGLILIGGSLTSNGNNTVEGATIAGLNILLGEGVTDSDIGNGTKTFQYHSCNLYWAETAAFGGLSQVPGSWFESM